MGQHVQARGLRATVGHRHLHQNVVGSTLRVFDPDIEITIVVEDAGVDQLEFRVGLPTPAVLFGQLGIGKGGVRVPI